MEIKNELLTEKLEEAQKALRKLNKKFRMFKANHIDCKKTIFLYRWTICLFIFLADAIVCLFFSLVAAYCCENHVGFNFEIISECIRSLDEFIDYLELNRVEDWIKFGSQKNLCYYYAYFRK